MENDNNCEFNSIINAALDEIGIMEDRKIEEWMHEICTYTTINAAYPQTISDRDHVRIMSMHSSKGLSAKFVVIMQCTEKIANQANKKSDYAMERKMEEDRRLFYVAITRCKCDKDYQGTLTISYHDNENEGETMPSRLISELGLR